MYINSTKKNHKLREQPKKRKKKKKKKKKNAGGGGERESDLTYLEGGHPWPEGKGGRSDLSSPPNMERLETAPLFSNLFRPSFPMNS